MYKDNIKHVNYILAKNLAWCFIALIILVLTKILGIFRFDTFLMSVIIGVGFFVCFGPIILYKLKVSDKVLQYYMHISLGILIALLGTNNGIGIYISYILVPIMSCLYFDKKFTHHIGLLSYFMMAGSVFFNCFGKMEVKYYGWTPFYTFVLYMIGFTIEYFVVFTFIYQIVRRSQKFLEEQQDSLRILNQEKERRAKLVDLYSDSLAGQRKTAYDMLSRDAMNFSTEDIAKITTGHQFVTQIQETFKFSADFYDTIEKVFESIGDYFGIDRIFYIENVLEEERSQIAFQWARKEEDLIKQYYSNMSQDEYEDISKSYDLLGYLEIQKNSQINSDNVLSKGFSSELGKDMYSKLLGSQFWLPSMENGKYIGAFCFDKYDQNGYTTVDKIILSDIVAMISFNILKINANNANRAKSAFLSTMSHEIRTPMNAILGMTSVALREDMNDTVRKSLKVIQSSSEGLLGIINDILDFSKIESGRIDILPGDYHILSLVNDVCTILNARNENKNLELKYEISEDMPSVLFGDMVRIKQVMVNLGSNAIKYTDVGSVTIRVSAKNQENKTTILRFEVEDTGQGIKEEDLGKLFKSFSQVNQVQNHHKEGTGLGLAISKQLVELMNGKIGVKSTFGKGSLFYFDIPQNVVDATPAGKFEEYDYEAEGEEEIEPFDASKNTILLVVLSPKIFASSELLGVRTSVWSAHTFPFIE